MASVEAVVCDIWQRNTTTFLLEGKPGKRQGKFFIGGHHMEREGEKSDHYILHWDINNYLEENCLQNYTVGSKTSHSFIPKG